MSTSIAAAVTATWAAAFVAPVIPVPQRPRPLRARLEAAETGEVAEPLGWTCVSGCGACCMLGTEERPFLKDLLTEEQLEIFRSLPKEDGWCRHFDHETRSCNIYDERPEFCRVKTFLCSKAPFFGVDPSDGLSMGGFCADSCRQNIADVYGQDSEEMFRFDAEVEVFLDIDEETDDEELRGSLWIEESDGQKKP